MDLEDSAGVIRPRFFEHTSALVTSNGQSDGTSAYVFRRPDKPLRLVAVAPSIKHHARVMEVSATKGPISICGLH